MTLLSLSGHGQFAVCQTNEQQAKPESGSRKPAAECSANDADVDLFVRECRRMLCNDSMQLPA